MRAFFSTEKTPANWPEPFWRDLLLTNLQRMRLLAKIYIGITAGFVLANAAGTYVNGDSSAELIPYIPWFSLMPLLNAILLVLLRRQKVTADTINVRRTFILVVTYLIAVQSIAAVIAGVTAVHYNHITAHLMAVMLAAASVILPWQLFLLPAVISSAILLSAMRLLQPGVAPLGEIFTVLLFMPVAALTSHMLLFGFYHKWAGQQSLKNEIEAGEILAIQLQEANNRLTQLAAMDELTGVANRRGLKMYMDNIIAAGPLPLGVIMVDIDNFKEYNDRHGHHRGDAILTTVARTLAAVVPKQNGMAVRWGGEEFLVVIPGQKEQDVTATCQRIQQNISELALPHGNSPIDDYITVSQGATSTTAANYDDVSDAVHRADTALYMVKQAGRNTYKYVTPHDSASKITP